MTAIPVLPISQDDLPLNQQQNFLLIGVAVVSFAALSLWAAISSEGFLEADAVTHYLYARFAFDEPHYFVNVWGRPMITGLYAAPAYYFGRIGVRVTSLIVAILLSWTTYTIAKGQKQRYPALAMIFVLAQPLVFLHSFSELTELPFALVLALAFLAYQRRQFMWMALLIGISPLGRPEGFGFIGLAGLALLLHRQWRWIPYLFVGLLCWTYAGWRIFGAPKYDSSLPYYLHGLLWLKHEWPYAGESLYDRGNIFKYLALLPAVVSPLLFPAMIVGVWRAFSPSPLAGEGRGEGEAQSVSSDENTSSRTTLTPHPNPLPQGEREPELLPLPLGEGGGEGARSDKASSQSDNPLTLTLSRWERGQDRCEALIAIIPFLILIGHSILHALGKMASSGELRYLLVVSPFWALLASRGWEYLVPRLWIKSPIRWAVGLALLPCLIQFKVNVFGTTVGYQTLPLRLNEDMIGAKQDALMLKSTLRHSYPRVIASHPGVFYFLDISPTNPNRVIEFTKANVTTGPPGTILVWDPIYGRYNSDTRRSVTEQDIDLAGWVLYPFFIAPNHGNSEMYLSPKDITGADTPYRKNERISGMMRQRISRYYEEPPPQPPK